jgi:uncharacterized protein
VKVAPHQIFVSDNIGNVSAELVMPEKSIAIVVLAHGAGAGMNHPFMSALSQELALQGISTLRFNFPFKENKKGRPDTPAIAHKTIEAAINKAHELSPSTPLFASGKSFGGRMASQLISKNPSPVKGIIFFGFPLHPSSKPSIERAEHLKEVSVPMLFMQGTRDELAQSGLIESVTGNLSLATLCKIEGADHAFKAGKKNLIPELAILTKKWISDLI